MDSTVPNSPAMATAKTEEITVEVEVVQPTTEVPFNAVDVGVGGTFGAAEGTTSSQEKIGMPEGPSPPQLGVKRGKGRPKGSGKSQNLAFTGGLYAGTAGENFQPYRVTVRESEDLAQKVFLFFKAVFGTSFVLTAVGPVCKAEVSKVEYEGDFEIIFITASQTIGSTGKKITIFNIELADTDNGKVFGGEVTGPVIAAGPIQMIMGGFQQQQGKKKKACGMSPLRPIQEVDERPEERVVEEPEGPLLG